MKYSRPPRCPDLRKIGSEVVTIQHSKGEALNHRVLVEDLNIIAIGEQVAFAIADCREHALKWNGKLVTGARC